MMIAILEAFFWGAAGVLAYVVVVFPALVWVRARFGCRPLAAAEVTPPVSLIVVAHNEETAIAGKIESILALDYPRDHLQVIVASDGSTDRTESIVRAHEGDGIQLLALSRVGKAEALNAAVAHSAGEVLVFSDANGLFEQGALRALMRPFADAEVGGVAGNQVYRRRQRDGGASGGELAYWSLDRCLKRWESAAGSVISATGALYAVRRSLFQPVPEGVTDDFVISTRVVARGRRLVFVPQAVVWESVGASTAAEFARKVRIMTRGLRALVLMRELFDLRRHGFYAVQVLSHKLLRRLAAIPLLVLLIVTPFLAGQGAIYRAAAWAAAGVVAAALLGALLRGTRLGRLKMFTLPLFLAVAQWAALVAIVNLIRGRRIDRWEPRRESGAKGDAAARGPALARHDWRFLLADPRPRRVAAVGRAARTAVENLDLVGGEVTIATDANIPFECDSFDVVVAHEPSASDLALAARLVRPGGVIYVEDHGLLGGRTCGRWLRFRLPSAQAAALAALRLTEIEIHGHWPSFASCTRIVPLTDRDALLHLVGARDRDGFARLRSWIGRMLVGSGALAPLMPCYSILAFRPQTPSGRER